MRTDQLPRTNNKSKKRLNNESKSKMADGDVDSVAVAVTVVAARHKDNALGIGYGPLSDGGM